MLVNTPPVPVAILVLPKSSASTVYGMYDIFMSTNTAWESFTKGRRGERLIHPILVSRDGLPLLVSNGVQIFPHTSLAECPEVAVICVPEAMEVPKGSEELSEEMKWLRERYSRGTVVAAACSGPVLLAEAGLLDGYDAATHWAWCDLMRSRYPKVSVQEERTLVVSGKDKRLIMGGAGTSWMDMALYVIARTVNIEVAMQVARVWLIDWHAIGQQPFASLVKTQQVEDGVVARCLVWIGENYTIAKPVSAMIQLSGLSERDFKRRFSQATGMSPLEYVHALRLEEAKHLLESSDTEAEEIASELGYEDTSFFNRLFKRKVNLTPAQYRKHFGLVRKLLAEEMKSATKSSN